MEDQTREGQTPDQMELEDICWEDGYLDEMEEEQPQPSMTTRDVPKDEPPEYALGRLVLLWAYDKATAFYEAIGRHV